MVLKKYICQTNVISETYKYFQNKRDCTTDSKTSHPDINTDGPAWQWISWRSSCSRNATAWSDTGRRLTSAFISTFMTCIPKFSIDCTNIFDWTIIESYSLNKKASFIYFIYLNEIEKPKYLWNMSIYLCPGDGWVLPLGLLADVIHIVRLSGLSELHLPSRK